MRKRGIYSVSVDIKVPFFDVDMMHVVWHGHYVKYLEEARCVLLESINYGYEAMRDSGYSWPIIDLQLRYMHPAAFGQALTVRAELVEWENRLKIHYLIQDAKTGTRLTRASSVQVAVSIASRTMQLSSPDCLLQAVARIDPSRATE
ncbi:thioesterase [Pollutimonas nitritireducens]|uniref:Thioesterase n=1 Tax=Pollutimonas nitritireducens TaxID=2045209 RepID=A0A2N4UEH0_9BURK|nr:acyl-CoA thioesterase [Pollutimonas nitritireducens]PLC53420.1 thioesterase [Pollutimonas nitritireducens]